MIRRTKVLGTSIGARTSGIDLVRRHEYEIGARIFLPVRSYSDERVAGNLSYQYRGLGNPSLGLSLSQDWDEDGARLYRESTDAPTETFFVLERERRASGSMTLVKPKARSSVSFTVSGGLVREYREVLDSALRKTHRFRLDDPRSTLGELSVRFSATNARSSAFQMGQATGTSFSVRIRRRHDLSRASNDHSVDDIRGTVRTYARLPLWFPGRQFAAPVLALRASAGASRGPGSDNAYFDLGGAESITFPARGYDTSTRSGQHAWSASLEYRAPPRIGESRPAGVADTLQPHLLDILRRRRQHLGTRHIAVTPTPLGWHRDYHRLLRPLFGNPLSPRRSIPIHRSRGASATMSASAHRSKPTLRVCFYVIDNTIKNHFLFFSYYRKNKNRRGVCSWRFKITLVIMAPTHLIMGRGTIGNIPQIVNEKQLKKAQIVTGHGPRPGWRCRARYRNTRQSATSPTASTTALNPTPPFTTSRNVPHNTSRKIAIS